MKIRCATLADLHEITEIYNQAVLKTVGTFDIRARTIDEQLEWYKKHDDKFAILVAEEDNIIIAWASLSKWSEKCAYNPTAEISIYVDEKHQGYGVGKLLFSEMINHAINCNHFHSIISRIAAENRISIRLHELFGFKLIGVMKEVGYKFNRYIDISLYQLMLDKERK